MTKDLKVKFLDEKAKLPTKAYPNDAGLDIFSISEVIIPPGEQKEVKTGIAIEVPKNYFTIIATRSSYGKNWLRCHMGIIDAGYRNEVSVWIFNHGKLPFEIKVGDKIAQLIILPNENFNVKEVVELSNSVRGKRGHGSSGK